jgi:hypothetical protein
MRCRQPVRGVARASGLLKVAAMFDATVCELLGLRSLFNKSVIL